MGDHSDIDHTGLTGVGGSGDVATDDIWTTAGKVAVATGTATATEQWPHGHEIAYVEFTSDVTINATTEATANEIVSAGTVAFDGSTRVKVEYWFEHVVTAASGANLQIWIYDDSSSFGRIGRFLDDSASRAGAYGVRFLTPSNASHTYSIRGSTGSGSATIAAGAGTATAAMPGWVRITVA